MWAVGGLQKSPAYKPVLQRLTGDTWSDVALPASVQPYRLGAASATSGSNLWVAAQLNTSGDSNALLRWNGTTWTTYKVPLSFQPYDIATAGSASTWAISVSTAKHWNGTAWADTPIGPPGHQERVGGRRHCHRRDPVHRPGTPTWRTGAAADGGTGEPAPRPEAHAAGRGARPSQKRVIQDSARAMT